MIWQAFFDWFNWLVSWANSQLPAIPDPPAFVTAGMSNVGVVMSYVNSFCGWIDLGLAKQAVTAVIGVYFAGLALRLARIVFGFFVG